MTRLLYIILIGALCTLGASAQSFRIHKGPEVTETRDPISFADHADADYIEVRGATFALSVTDVTQTSCTLSVTPSNDAVCYYYDVCTRQTLDDNFHGNVATLIEGYILRLYEQYSSVFSLEAILAETLAIGPDSDQLSGLPAGTEMAFYAMAVDDEGHCVGEPALAYFTTAPAGDPKDCSYTIDVSHVRSTDCIVSITPSDASVPYWYGICAVSEWPGDYAMTTEVSDALYEYAKEYNTSIRNVASRVVFTGPISMEESGLIPSTAYYAYCYAMDTETGDALGPVSKVRFATLDYDRSDAQIAMSVRLFDGDDLIAAYPERFGSAAEGAPGSSQSVSISGRCYMQVVVTPSASCTNWAVALAKGDLTDETTYPEETTKNAVLQGGRLSHSLNNFVCDWSATTLFGFGVDAMGIDGPLQRQLILPSRSEVSPASEFILDSGAAAYPAAIPANNNQYIIIKIHNYEKVHLYSPYRHRQLTRGMGR